MLELYLSKEDFKVGRRLMEEEKIYPITYENMFVAGIYCILSAAEKHSKHVLVYNKLVKTLDIPEKILSNKEKLRKIVSVARFPNLKTERIYNFASWWVKNSLPKRILKDINSGREKEFELRNELAEECPGISYKGASLFMVKCGYENVVPIDLWMLRFLRSLGYEVEIPDYKKKSGPKPREYLEYEKIISEITRKLKVSPAFLQFTVWSKFSKIKNSKKLS
ncbi:MAG: hypothetical protein QXS48_05060 [Candidatus Aenigmatarchaeota archaeon]